MFPQLQTATLHLGTWLSLGSPVAAELAGECGFDWLLIDLEHGCGTEAALLPQLQALRGSPAAKIVRVAAPHPDLILHVLDWGADGLMVPHIDTVQDAERVIEAAHYPPRGRRGLARTTRSFGYGLRQPVEGAPMPTPIILAQIESLPAVENAAAIAAVDGIDALFVGPTDLTHDLRSRDSARTLDECLPVVVEAATAAGKQAGILLRQPEDLARHQALGFTWLAVSSDLNLLRENFLRLAAYKSPPPPAGA
jgi:2-keto-3-deoxy-L-rhamnonate aldolase RhmA